MNANNIIDESMTSSILHELFVYRSGNLYWRNTGKGRGDINRPAGSYDKHSGYSKITISRKQYGVHQIIWAMHNEMQQEGMHIDHINGDRNDNRIENLRSATVSENARNRKLATNNTSGFNGVHQAFTRQGKERWVALITVDSKVIRLGRFNNKEQAIKARQEADVEYGYANGTR